MLLGRISAEIAHHAASYSRCGPIRTRFIVAAWRNSPTPHPMRAGACYIVMQIRELQLPEQYRPLRGVEYDELIELGVFQGERIERQRILFCESHWSMLIFRCSRNLKYGSLIA
jgi:hypothetical protein